MKAWHISYGRWKRWEWVFRCIFTTQVVQSPVRWERCFLICKVHCIELRESWKVDGTDCGGPALEHFDHWYSTFLQDLTELTGLKLSWILWQARQHGAVIRRVTSQLQGPRFKSMDWLRPFFEEFTCSHHVCVVFLLMLRIPKLATLLLTCPGCPKSPPVPQCVLEQAPATHDPEQHKHCYSMNGLQGGKTTCILVHLLPKTMAVELSRLQKTQWRTCCKPTTFHLSD